jgi:BASS family bile acid:Na+ symporter
LIAAKLLRKIYPAARELPKKLSTATFGLWSVCLFVIAASAAHFFKTHPEISRFMLLETAVTALVICAVNFAVGHLLGEKNFKREASQSLGQKNTTLTIYLAFAYAGPLAAMGVISYVLWHNSYNAVQMFLTDRKASQTRAEK